MRKKLRLFSSALLFAAISTVQAQSWVEATTNFTIQNTGIVAGSIQILNANVAVAIGYDGTGSGIGYYHDFILTTDGGINWAPKTIKTTAALPTSAGISNISLINSTTAFIGIFDDTYKGTNIGIWKTTDMGTNWIKSSAPFSAASWPDFVHFFDANNGIAFGDPIGTPSYFEIYTTTDGGANWTRSSNTNGALTPIQADEYGEYGNFFVKGNTIWTGTNYGRMFKSTDKGLTWTAVQTPVYNGTSSAFIGRIAFRDANNGLSTITNPTSGNYEYIKTTDGGSTWNKITPATSIYSSDLCVVPGTNTYVITGATLSPKKCGSAFSTDDGTTWNILADTTGSKQMTAVAFLNSKIGYAGSFNSPPNGAGGMFKWTSTVGLRENENATPAIAAYPNPTTGNVYVSLSGFEIKSASMKISTILGETIAEINTITNTQQIDLSSLPNGIYILFVADKNKSAYQRIVKQ